jgi:hypothetical protein
MKLCPQCQSVITPGGDRCTRCHYRLSTAVESPAFESSSVAAIRTEAGPDETVTYLDGRFFAPGATEVVSGRDMPMHDQMTGTMTLQETPHTSMTPPPAHALSEIVRELKPWLIVVRGERLDVSFPVLPGQNVIGRMGDQPVDINLDGQEPIERVWTSRRHAVLHYLNDEILVEDLSSLNGTFVNRSKIPAGSSVVMQEGDILQMGTVQLALRFSAQKP